MPKKRSKSRLFPASPLVPFGATASGVESFLPGVSQVQILDHFDTTVTQGITTEKTLLSGTFFMPEGIEVGADLFKEQAIINYWFTATLSTDAAAGTNTFRVKINGDNLFSSAAAESNNASTVAVIWHGEIILGPSDGGTGVGTGANGSFYRLAAPGIFSNQVGVASTSVTGLGLDYGAEGNTVEITIQSSDAGTNLDECHGWMTYTIRTSPIEEG